MFITTLEEARAESVRIVGLLRCETTALVDFLIALSDFDRKRGFEVLGHATLWTYCRDELRLTENQTAVRFRAVRIIQEYTLACEYLRDGRLNMSTLLSLKKALTQENAKALFDRASWKSETESDEIACSFIPKPAHVPAPVVRKVAAAVPVAEQTKAPDPTVTPAFELRPPPRIEPEWADGFKVTLHFDGAFKAKLDTVKAMLSHSIPDGDPRKVFERGLDLILETEAKKGTGRRRASNGSHIPAWMEKAVRERDGNCCVWELASGKRCGSTWQTQVDHIVAVALGGKTELANLRVLCRQHNLLHARQTFGHEFMKNKIGPRRPV